MAKEILRTHSLKLFEHILWFSDLSNQPSNLSCNTVCACEF